MPCVWSAFVAKPSGWGVRCWLGACLVVGAVTARAETAYTLLYPHHSAPLISQTQGTHQGVLVDVVRAVAQRTGVQLHWQPASGVAAERDAQHARADAVLMLHAPLHARLPGHEVTLPLLESEFVLVQQDEPERAARSSRFRVGVEPNGIAMEWALYQQPAQLELALVEDWPRALQALQDGQVDALVMDRWLAQMYLNSGEAAGLRIGNTPVARGYAYLAVKPGQADLLELFNSELRAMQADGTLNQIHAAWGSHKVVPVARQIYQLALGLGGLVLCLLVAMVWTNRKLAAAQRKALELRHEALQAERTAKASRHRLNTILDTVVDAVLTLDERGTITHANRSTLTLFGFAARDVLHHSILKLLPDGLRELNLHHGLPTLVQVGPNGVIGQGCESWGRRRDGRTIPLHVSLAQASVTDETCYVVCLTDVSTEVQARECARAAQKTAEAAQQVAERAARSKDVFLSNMSHELRTPMNAIMGFGQMLQYDPALNADQQDSVQEILRASEHLLSLINDVLDLSKISVAKMVFNIEPVPVSEVLRECRNLVTPLLLQHAITLHIDPHADAHSGHVLLADRLRLKQVLINLLSNAIKYNRPHGQVQVGLQEVDDGRLRLSVRDTGHGIPPEHHARLFEPFNRLGFENSGIEGTGIGLSIACKMVEGMQGRMGFDSVVGVGSTFWFELPLEFDLLPPQAPALLQASDHGTPVPYVYCETEQLLPRVLCIDDNATNLKLFEKMLGQSGRYEVWTAQSATHGLELALRHVPDLILLDIKMPDMDGYALLQQLQRHKATARVPVFAVTAQALTDDVQKGLDAGFARYIVKPVIDVQGFFLHINDALDKSRAEMLSRPLARQGEA